MGNEEFIEGIATLAHKLAEASQQFERRLRFSESRFADEYINCRAEVIFEFGVSGRTEERFRAHLKKCVAVVDVAAREDRFGLDGISFYKGCNQRPVLVDVIQLPESANRRIPTSVRAYLVHEQRAKVPSNWGGNGDCVCAVSVIDATKKVLFVVPEREVQISGFGVLGDLPDRLSPNVIETSAQIVDGVPDSEWHIMRELYVPAKRHFLESGLRIDLVDNSICLGRRELPESRLHLIDVLIAPV